MADQIFFGAAPYVLLTIAVVGLFWRFSTNRYSWSTQSSQFLENRTLFFGSFPWHYGIITILVGHFIAFLIPSLVFAWNGAPARLYLLELVGLALGFLALFGLLALIYRRITNARVKTMTSSWDVLILIILIIQVVTGLGNAIFYRWGSNWYAAAAVPWMWSILKFNPNVDFVRNLPLNTKIHIFNAMIFIGFIPFSRLVHFVVINPYKYLVRPYQVVRWYHRNPKTENIVQYK
ncbi:MAG: respiratory nitrate reductase subunit gamma [Deltaproteobacteria bacterium]|nr:respiratory nitrate reductase subunit gamma [Deltaproteobacteria bacterium]